MNAEDNISYNNVTIDIVSTDIVLQKNIHLSVLRLGKIHPIISGNKWFKLQYYLQEAKSKAYTTLLTFGGAFSNHIIATAYAANMHQFSSIGIIRGEKPSKPSHTLQQAEAKGMKLHFVSRQVYNELKKADINTLTYHFGNCYVIPEGGYGNLGAKGIASLFHFFKLYNFTHIIAGVGTGTTIAGIANAALPQQQVMGISVMKNNFELEKEIAILLEDSFSGNLKIFHDYHFGGYAKYTAALVNEMNEFYDKTNIPLDFVYTGKVIAGINDLIRKDFFKPRAEILFIHTGGLQGNLSLKPDVLHY